MDADLSRFKNGHWVWDYSRNRLAFIKDIGSEAASQVNIAASKAANTTRAAHDTRFKDTYDAMDMVRFRRYFQRKCKSQEPEVVTIQDLKDIILYSSNPKDLSPEFILYLHIPVMDKVIRALIIYFQYYVQVWEKLLDRREESKRKLRQPIVDELEGIISQNLADLRSMVAREYSNLILGIDEALPFHHLKNTETMSLSDRDRRLFETWINVVVRIVWVALQRKYISIIEKEMHRMFRTELFNLVSHKSKRMTSFSERTPEEGAILDGKANVTESKLLQRSSLVKELLFGHHDHRMLGIGIAEFQPIDDRNNYLEIAYSAPEELLHEYNITVGLLGIPRHEFDCFLVTRERTSKTFNIPITELTDFQPPETIKHSPELFCKTYPSEPPQFFETQQTKRSRIQQKKLWYEYIFSHRR